MLRKNSRLLKTKTMTTQELQALASSKKRAIEAAQGANAEQQKTQLQAIGKEIDALGTTGTPTQIQAIAERINAIVV